MAYGPPPGAPPGPQSPVDPKSVNPLDWATIGAGALAFIFSFISYYTADVELSGNCPAGTSAALGSANSESASAWHGFFGWFAALLAVAGAAAIAISIFAPHVKLPVPARLAALGAFGLATISVLLALPITPGGDDYHQTFSGCTIDAGVGHGFGYWVSLVVIVAGAVVTFLRFQQTGGQLPIGGAKGPGASGLAPQQGFNAPPAPPPPPPPPPAQQPPPPPPPQH